MNEKTVENRLVRLDPTEFVVVEGRGEMLLSHVSRSLETGDAGKPVVYAEAGDTRRYWLFDRSALGELAILIASWTGTLGELLRIGREVGVALAGQPPSSPAVELDGPRVTALWIETAPARPLLSSRPPRHSRPPSAATSAPPVSEPPSSEPPRRRRDGLLGRLRRRRAGVAAPAPVDRGIHVPDRLPGSLEAGPVQSELCRTAHMDLRHEEPLRAGTPFTVEVWCDEEAPRQGEEGQAVSITAAADCDELPVRVWLAASAHFEIASVPQVLTLRRSEGRSATLRFEATVAAAPPAGEPGQLSAMFVHNGRPAGSVTRVVALEGSAAAPPDVAAPLRPGAVELDTAARPADLVVQVTKVAGDDRQFVCTLSTPLLPGGDERSPEAWHLAERAPDLVAQFMEDFMGATEPAQRIARLRGAGRKLFDAAPEGFRRLYWELVDAGRPPRTILVASQDWAFPWELMVPYRTRADGSKEKHEPLGVRLAVGRWITDTHLPPPQRVPLADCYTFAPLYDEPYMLEHAPHEVAFVQEHFNGTAIHPGSRASLDYSLGSRAVALLHLACHGESSQDSSQVLMLEGAASLLSYELPEMAGVAHGVGGGRPLVFLNACEVGRLGPALIGVSGFPVEFIELGASAVVAPLWSVVDVTAHEVAKQFYTALVAAPERPFADVLREIRGRAYAEDTSEDTYAAYCFYGDPLAAQG
jgi:hypothetical protein